MNINHHYSKEKVWTDDESWNITMQGTDEQNLEKEKNLISIVSRVIRF